MGWGNTKFKYKPTFAIDGKTKRSNAFVAGLGLTTLLTDHVTLGAEWKYSFYKEVKVDNNKMKPRTNDFRVRLAYKW